METLADFKRALKIGSKWCCYNHRYEKMFPVREVVEVTTVCFRLQDPKTKRISTCYFPKSCDTTFGYNDCVKIYVLTISTYCSSDRGRVLLLCYKPYCDSEEQDTYWYLTSEQERKLRKLNQKEILS